LQSQLDFAVFFVFAFISFCLWIVAVVRVNGYNRIGLSFAPMSYIQMAHESRSGEAVLLSRQEAMELVGRFGSATA
jgi:hypothetical protein